MSLNLSEGTLEFLSIPTLKYLKNDLVETIETVELDLEELMEVNRFLDAIKSTLTMYDEGTSS